jgi:hypothetical protein
VGCVRRHAHRAARVHHRQQRRAATGAGESRC